MSLPEAPSKWCFISSQCQIHSNAGNETTVQFDKIGALLWAYLTIEYLLIFSSSFRVHYICIWGKHVPYRAAFSLNSGEGMTAHHSSHLLRNPTVPKAERAMACAWFILWNNCTLNVLYIVSEWKGRTWRPTEVKKSSFHFPRFYFKFYMQGTLAFSVP